MLALRKYHSTVMDIVNERLRRRLEKASQQQMGQEPTAAGDAPAADVKDEQSTPSSRSRTRTAEEAALGDEKQQPQTRRRTGSRKAERPASSRRTTRASRPAEVDLPREGEPVEIVYMDDTHCHVTWSDRSDLVAVPHWQAAGDTQLAGMLDSFSSSSRTNKSSSPTTASTTPKPRTATYNPVDLTTIDHHRISAFGDPWTCPSCRRVHPSNVTRCFCGLAKVY